MSKWIKEFADNGWVDWICPKCGSYHDRDINASINILFEGIKKYMQEFIS